MLTDYHLHLRPDEDDTPPQRFFTAENVARYRAAAEEAGVEELGVAEHIHRFAQALEISAHPWYRHWARDDVDAYCDFARGNGLRLGIEADFLAGREDRIAAFLERREWDYVVGSVHFLRDEMVDVGDDEPRWAPFSAWRRADPEKLWRRYFETLAEAARSGLFDILAHPDLVKVFGEQAPRPEGDLRRFYEPAIEAIAESGVAVEVSTAGLRKPVGEIYPSRPFAEMCVEAGAPFALSSDAHLPAQVGYGYERALELLASLGVEEICVFERRRRAPAPLGGPMRDD